MSNQMPVPDLDIYRFDLQAWDSYEDLQEAFSWEIPEEFNLATYLCDRWAELDGTSRTALKAIGKEGAVREVSYGTLETQSDTLATHLQERGVEKGDRISIVASQRPSTLIGFLAAWKLGAIVVPLSPKYGMDAIRYRLNDADVRVCLADDPILGKIRELLGGTDELAVKHVIPVGTKPVNGEVALSDLLDSGSSSFTPERTEADDPAMILYTSGTTGKPKGVIHAHHTVLGMLPSYALSRCNGETSYPHTVWVPAAWSWIASLTYVLPALYYGHALLGDVRPRFDPLRMYEKLVEYEVTMAFFPRPAMNKLRDSIDDYAEYTHPHMKVIMIGNYNEAEDAWLREVFPNAVVHLSYGQTEASLPIGHCSALFDAPMDSIGRAMPGHDIQVRDREENSEMPDGEHGQIAIRYGEDPALLESYWGQNSDKIDEKIQDGWLWTDDFGAEDADGNIYYHGRIDDVINCSGFRVGPTEIESVLVNHDAISEAGVIGVPDDNRSEVPKAFVVLESGYTLTETLIDELQTLVKDEYALYAYPRRIENISALPVNDQGKLQRNKLREREGLIEP